MKAFIFLGVLFAIAVSFQTVAPAAEAPFCLESADGGGGSTVNCSFETMAQCMASKSGSDRCYENPRLGRR